MAKLRLGNGTTIEIRPITDPRVVLRMMAPFARLKEHPPTDQAGQEHMVAAAALALSPHITGIEPIALADHFTAYPLDMEKVTTAVLGEWAKK